MAVELGEEVWKFGRREVATAVPDEDDDGDEEDWADGKQGRQANKQRLETPGAPAPDPVTQTAGTVSCTGGPTSSSGGGRRVAR